MKNMGLQHRELGVKQLAGMILILGSAFAQASGPGTSAGNILNMPMGARAIAMGEAYTAQADDVSSLYWNPAGLAILNQSQASFMYSKEYMDMSLSQAAVATPLENGGIGASVSYLSYGKISGFDQTGNATGDLSAYDGVATLGGAWLGNNWSLGANLKGIQSSLADVKATGFAADTGLNLVYPREVLSGTLRFGATYRNMGTGLKYISEKDPFPSEWRMGLALVQMMNRKLNVSADYGKVRDTDGSMYAGLEYWLGPFLALRAGYAGNHSESNGLRAGMGLKMKDLSFDYAYTQYGDLGMVNRFELALKFGAIRPTLTPEERDILRRGKQAMKQGHYGDAVLLFDSLIQMEPRYKPVKRLVKMAMAGDEKQEKTAKNLKTYHYSTAQTNTKAADELGDLADLENLLNLGNNDATAKASKK